MEDRATPHRCHVSSSDWCSTPNIASHQHWQDKLKRRIYTWKPSLRYTRDLCVDVKQYPVSGEEYETVIQELMTVVEAFIFDDIILNFSTSL